MAFAFFYTNCITRTERQKQLTDMANEKSMASRHEEVKKHVIEVASKAFHTNGIKNVTMDTIAHSLCMSKRTLYQMFADKEDLLLACVKSHDNERKAELAALAEKTVNVLEFILAFFAESIKDAQHINADFFSELLKYPKLVDFHNKKHKMEENDAVAFLNKGIEQGYFRQDINFHIVYNQISEGINIILRNDVMANYPNLEVFKNTVLLYIRGCATLKGIEMIDAFIEKHESEFEM